MDVNALRIGVTLLSFLVFIGIVAFAWSKQNQAGFSDAAELPFRDSLSLDEQTQTRPRS